MNAMEPPDRIYAELFEEVQAKRLLGDSKTFVDAVPRSEPASILAAYRAEKKQRHFDLAAFVERHFELPETDVAATTGPAGLPVEERIEQLWDLLMRGPDSPNMYSSLIALPNRYVVPGGRFREVYYWDSYFTMLGLAESGRTGLIREMVENFAWLIDRIGFIPNGNRSYYCTRSQPPFFALMVELLAEACEDETVYERFLPQLRKEYAFWMAGAELLTETSPAHRRVVLGPGGYLNRYWDDVVTPRPESYAEDIELAEGASREPEQLYRDIRAGAESGWDYSSRWLGDRRSMKSIRTSEVIPVDLNSLMYKLEATLAQAFGRLGDDTRAAAFELRAGERKRLLQDLFFDTDSGLFVDLQLPGFDATGTASIATAYPLFFGIASRAQATDVADRISEDFLKAGGWVTSNHDTGQQWDSPNGWAPMQWITFCGLERYGFHEEARTGAKRWVENNIDIYQEHGCLLEKYNVESRGLAGTGGEYEVQEGFGWTNAVLLRLMHKLRS